jgi:hypothetical protein
MPTAWLLIPAPHRPLLDRLADRYERTGQGEGDLAKAFLTTLRKAEALEDYAILVAGCPAQS